MRLLIFKIDSANDRCAGLFGPVGQAEIDGIFQNSRIVMDPW